MSKTEAELLKQILKEVQEITTHLSDIDNGLDNDRHNIQNLTVNTSTLIEEVSQTRKAVNTTSEKVKNKVADTVAPIVEATDRMTTEIHDKEVVTLKEDKRTAWQKFWGIKETKVLKSSK
jgi:methyl-accepting chemotaxis protein